MRLKYHFESETEGVLVLEAEPQMRNLFVYSQTGNNIRVPMPYTIFVVRYIKDGDKLFFPGVWGSGLRVFGKSSPITSMTDNVFLLPTDAHQGGYVCTPHNYDMHEFKDLETMVKTIVSIWWNLRHNCSGVLTIKDWQACPLSEIEKIKWQEPLDRRGKKVLSAFWDALKVGYYLWNNGYIHANIPSFDTNVPLDGAFIDEPWDQKENVLDFAKLNAPPEEVPVKRKRGRPKKVKV